MRKDKRDITDYYDPINDGDRTDTELMCGLGFMVAAGAIVALSVFARGCDSANASEQYHIPVQSTNLSVNYKTQSSIKYYP